MLKQKVQYMEEKVFEISAKEVTIEVIDEATGKTYRRTLPIDYYETANGLVLRGENGSISQLVFYSARGMQRMQDLPIEVYTAPCLRSDRPMYLGKRHFVRL
jgi:hypothetical protein